jgi:hypothetical protein
MNSRCALITELRRNKNELKKKLFQICRHRRWRTGSQRCKQGRVGRIARNYDQTSPDTMPPLVPANGRPYNPVVTLNGWTLPWRMKNGVKEFHLVAEPVVREMAPE